MRWGIAVIEIHIRCDLCNKDSGLRDTGRRRQAATLRLRLGEKGWVPCVCPGSSDPQPQARFLCPECGKDRV